MGIAERDISKLMKELHVPSHLKGKDNLVEALKIVGNEGKYIQVTKNIYYPLAKKNHTSPSAIERSMSYVIDELWRTQNLSKYGFDMNGKKPTTKNFIFTLSDYLTEEE